MLFMITQVHTPLTCSKDEGGADVLIDKNAQGVTVKGRWGAWSHHTIWYLVEADSLDAIQRFVDPGTKRCTCTVAPATESPTKMTLPDVNNYKIHDCSLTNRLSN